MSDKDEITLKEAAEYVKRQPPTDGSEATAVLDAMLAASRHGKTVKGQQ